MKQVLEDKILEMEGSVPELNIKGGLLGYIRTLNRNNVDMTSIADNKANILISINSIMLTILIPIVLANYDIIEEKNLFPPLIVLSLTCITTIFISAQVLTPFTGSRVRKYKEFYHKKSPFFFKSYESLNFDEYLHLFRETTANNKILSRAILKDFYFVGIVLESKYTLVRRAYRLFKIGLLISFISFMLFNIL
jgi:hypothetical protein